MRKHHLTPWLAASAAIVLATGCANMSDTQRRTATGAGVGALAGAVIGSATGGNAGTGAVVGAGVGALGTYIWSQNMERQKREMEQATQGTGVAVTQTADNQLMLNIPSDISFAVGRSDIQPNFAPVLDQFAAACATTRRRRCASWATLTAQAAMRSTTPCRWTAPPTRATTWPHAAWTAAASPSTAWDRATPSQTTTPTMAVRATVV